MLMKDDKKKMATLIISKMKGGPEKMQENMSEEQPETEQDSNMGLESAAEDIMQALESKDKSLLIQGFKAMLSMLENEPQEESDLES